MKEQSSVTKGFMVLSIAGIIAKVLSAFYVPLLTGIIGEQGMGIYGKGYDVFMFVYAVTTMGCQPAVAKVISELKATGNENDSVRALKISRKTFGFIGGIAAILVIVLAYPIAIITKTTPAVFAIMFLGPSVFITAVLAAYRGYFQGEGDMHGIAISQVVEQILNVIISLLCAYILMKVSLPLGAAGGTIGTTVGAIIAVVYLIYVYDKKIRRKKQKQAENNHESKNNILTDKLIKEKLFAYALPITLIAGIQNFGGMVDMFNVNSRLLHAGYNLAAANTLYGYFINYRVLIGLPLIIITALTTIILPSVSKNFALKNRKAIIRQINFSYKVTFAITIPAAVGMSFLSTEIYKILFPTEKAAFIMTYGAFILVFMALAQVQSTILQGMSKFRPLLIAFAIGVVFKILGNYIFVGIREINIVGVLVGNFFYFAVPSFLCYRIIRRTVKYKIPVLKPCLKPIIASVFMGIFLYFGRMPFYSFFGSTSGFTGKIVTLIYTMILVIIGVIIYGAIMIVLGGIRKTDIESISPRLYGKVPSFIKSKMR